MNMQAAQDLLAQAAMQLRQLDGVDEKNLRTNDKNLSARKALIRRRMTYAAHLTELARLEIMNQYYAFGGEEPPEIIP